MKHLFLLFFLTLFGPSLFAQCSGFQIVADKSSVCAPEIIRYQLLNPVAGSTYEWNVGNGTVYGADTLFAFYTNAMTINATVKITLPSGAVCNITENNIAVVNPVPVPVFDASKFILCDGPASIELTDITPNSDTRSWVVDGTNYNSTGNTITHQFVTTGDKKVSLIVIDSNGCKGVGEFLDTIKVYPKLNFDFAGNSTRGCVPKAMSYSLTSDPSTPFTKTFTWSFPGANNTSHVGTTPGGRTYDSSGNYDATLQVDVSNGCTYTINKGSYMRLGDTVNLDLIASNTSFCSNETILLKQLDSPIIGTTTWTYLNVPVTELGGNNYEKQIRCNDEGNLTVELSHNYNACITTKTFNNIIEIKGVKADFVSTDYYHCEVPHTVHLTNLSDSMDATSVTYKWRILDAGSEYYTSTNEHDSFTFNTMPASYTVQLIAFGNNGCTDTLTREDYIYQDSLKLEFDANPSIACVGQQIQFLNNTKRSSYLSPDNFKWYFYALDNSTVLDSSEVESPTFSYSDTGYYSIMLTGQNGIGCRDTLLKVAEVHVISTESSFEIPDTIICTGETMTLLGKSEPANAGFTHNWTLKKINSSYSYSYTGDSVLAVPTVLGDYWAVYQSSISGGCFSKDSTKIYVNGIVTDIELDTMSGCAPLTVNPKPIIISDFHEGKASPAYSYEWNVVLSNGVTISDTFAEEPAITFAENGDYTISLVTTNVTGCSVGAESSTILTGVRAGFTIDDNIICLGDSLTITDLSYNGVTDIEWSLLPSGQIITGNDIGNQKIQFEIASPGVFELNQIVTRDNNCYDTIKQPFEVLKVTANFAAVDSFLQCAPVYAEFESTSSNADTLFWNFGDGNTHTTTSTSAGNIYTKNSGWTDGYDIILIAKNIEGCSDTARKDDYILVKGPLPRFKMENYVGCEPLEVTFTDQSIDGVRFFMNYNDGSSLDSSKVDSTIGTHTYFNRTTNNLRQTILPSMIVYDSLGCAAVFTPADSIVVYKKPIVEPVYQNGTDVCIPFNMKFADTGRFSSTWSWSLDSVIISTNSEDSIMKSDAGFYELELIASNIYGCTDTLNQTMQVFEKPAITINFSDTVCLNKVIDFTGVLTGNSPVQFFEWNFGENGEPNNTNTSSLYPQYTYTTKGPKHISLVAGLNNGCSDSSSVDILITGEDEIDNPQINYVSFTDNYTLEVDYEASTYDKFLNYIIQRSDGSSFTVSEKSTTQYIDVFGSKPVASMCYTIKVRDYCDLQGLASDPHCFIYLSASSINPYENVLEWTAYEGWPSVAEYCIFREDENGVYVKIGTVPGDQTSYVDPDLCDQDYNYYVQAQHPTELWTSNSFRVTQRPIFIANPLGSSIKNVTVSNTDEITVTWNKSTFNQFNNYVLQKFEDNESNFVSEEVLTDTFFVDYNVLTNEHSYIYRVTEQDKCNNSNISDREGKSILLRGHYLEGSHLYWTPYVNWLNGVDYYHAEIFNGSEFEYLHKNVGHDRDWVDRQYHKGISGEYCYRVYGFNSEGDTSYSNSVCLFGDPKAVLPTAFTPNKDGLNETFRPIAMFALDGVVQGAGSFEFTIFNRWGEKVFETNSIYDGWDGTYNGADCQQGAYIYSLKLKGLTNQMIYHSGTVTLLR